MRNVVIALLIVVIIGGGAFLLMNNVSEIESKFFSISIGMDPSDDGMAVKTVKTEFFEGEAMFYAVSAKEKYDQPEKDMSLVVKNVKGETILAEKFPLMQNQIMRPVNSVQIKNVGTYIIEIISADKVLGRKKFSVLPKTVSSSPAAPATGEVKTN